MKRQVKFCVRLHQGGYSYDSLRRVATEADRLGYYSLSLYDLLNAPALECWTTLTALAAQTSRIRLAPLVLANLYRHPVLLAQMSATLDVISGGRLELGIGAGGDPRDHRASGLPFPPVSQRVEMLAESVRLIRELWQGSPVNFQGSHYRTDGALCDPVPLQKPHPPVLIGGHGETYLLRAAAAHADIVNMRFDMSVDEHRRVRGVIESHCRSVGRDASEIEVSHNANVLIARDGDALEAVLSQQAQRQGVSPEEYRRSLGSAIVGTPEQCADSISRYVDAGATYFFLLFPEPVDAEQLALFACEVMPRFTG